MSRLGGLSTAATRSLGTPQWDAVLRGTGIVSLLAIYPAMQWPEVGALAAYLCITIFVNGPLAPLLPAAYEPIQIIMGRVYSPLLVALMPVPECLPVRSDAAAVLGGPLSRPFDGVSHRPIHAGDAFGKTPPLLPHRAVRKVAPGL